MTDRMSLTCPECNIGELLDMGDGSLACLNCDARYVSPQRLCPFCEAENELDAKMCLKCGRSLRTTCPRCSTINPVKAETCMSCGQAFDTIGHIAAREELRQADRFSLRAETVSGVKAAELAQAQQRADQMWAQEHQRQATLLAQRQKQRQQELRLMYVAIGFLVVAVAAIVLIALATSGG